MDKSWMDLPDRFGTQFIEGVKAFIAVAGNHKDSAGRTRCPCRICNNRYYKQIDEVKVHLLDHGMDKHYTRWVHHGEDYEVLSDDDDDDDDDVASSDEGICFDGTQDLIQDLRAPTCMDNSTFIGLNGSNGNPNLFDKLLSDAQKPLYPGCEKSSNLDFLMKLFHLKASNRWNDKSFDMLLELIKAALPPGETLPKSYQEAKTLMRELGLE